MGSRAAAAVMGLWLAQTAWSGEIDNVRAVALERLVVQDCGSCHGMTLGGGLGRPITPELMRHYDREVLRDIVLDGISGTAMPPWRPLITEAEALWIADYLRTGGAP